jgi:hypothetical protein
MRTDIKKKMRARAATLLGGPHPVLLSARADWLGRVKSIKITDVRNNKSGVLHLAIPFAPARQVGQPRKLTLTMECKNVRTEDTGLDDKKKGVVVSGPRGFLFFQEPPAELFKTPNRQLLTLKFEDEESKEYLLRKMYLSFSPNDSDYDNSSHISDLFSARSLSVGGLDDDDDDESLLTIDKSLYFDDVDKDASFIGDRGVNLEDSVVEEGSDGDNDNGIVESIYLVDYNDGDSIVTNVVSAEVVRGSFQWKGEFYLYRLYHEGDYTRACVLQVSDGHPVFLAFVSMSKYLLFMRACIMNILNSFDN